MKAVAKKRNMKTVAKKKNRSPISVKAKSVLDIAASSLHCGRNRTWFDRLGEKDKAWVSEVKAEYLSGNYPCINMSSLARAISSELGVTVSRNSMRIWMEK